MRAVAVALVLVFHAGFGWMSGGYLGVSVFFTLSGYLITNVLLDEHDTTGRVACATFYSRRMRRLLPASAACLLGIVVLRWLGEFRFVSSLRTDLLGAALQVSNWVQLAGSSSYTKLFDDSGAFASPVAHFWSLAIEEQFYLLWPVVLLGVVRAARGRHRRLLVLVAGLTVLFAVAAPVIAAVWGPDAAYWATPARLPELLIGACLAVALRPALISGWTMRSGPATALAAGCLAGIVALSVLLPSDGGPAFTGWLAPFALLSAGLLLGLQGGGPVRRVLSTRPLVWIGGISYALYLFHWPVYLVLRARGWVLTRPADLGLALGITFLLAWMSGRLLERPIRSASWKPQPVFAGAAALALVVVAVIVSMPTGPRFLDVDDGVLAAAAIQPLESPTPLVGHDAVPDALPTTTAPTASTATTMAPGAAGSLPALNRPVRVAVVGDSTALYVGQGLATWATEHPDQMQVDIIWSQGFGFLTSGTVTSWEATEFVERSREMLSSDIPDTLARVRPDVVLFMVTVDDVLDRRWSDTEGVLDPTDGIYRDRLASAYEAATTLALDQGVSQVMWVVPPVSGEWSITPELRDQERMRALAEVIRRTAGSSSTAGVIELGAWFEQTGRADDREWRPDGTHLTEESAARLAREFLGPELVGRAIAGAAG